MCKYLPTLFELEVLFGYSKLVFLKFKDGINVSFSHLIIISIVHYVNEPFLDFKTHFILQNVEKNSS